MTTDYGYEISCSNDIYPGRTVTGADVVIESVYRRVTTPRGTCAGAPDDGIDLTDYLHYAETTEGLASIASIVQSEIRKDDRVLSVSVGATFTSGVLTVTVNGYTSQRESFQLVVTVDELTVTLLDGGYS